MLSRQQTTQVKGIAVILLVMHHCLPFSKRQPYGLELKFMLPFGFGGHPIYEQLGIFGKICVPLFLFLGGYGLYASKVKKEGEDISILYGFSKTTIRLFTALWKVFVFFIPIGLIFFHAPGQYCEEHYIWNAFSDRSAFAFFSNFFAWSTSYNGEWWFFKYYLFCVFFGYVFIEIFKRSKNFYSEVFSVIIWSILAAHVFPFFGTLLESNGLSGNPLFEQFFAYKSEWNSSMLLMGIVFAKYDIFGTWRSLIKERMFVEKKILSVFGFVSVFILRMSVLGYGMDLLLVPFFTFCVIVFLEDIKWLSKGAQFAGKHSTNIWLVHTFYCYYYVTTAKIVYATRNPLISVLTLIAMCLVTSVLLELFWKWAGKGYKFLYNRGNMEVPQVPQ